MKVTKGAKQRQFYSDFVKQQLCSAAGVLPESWVTARSLGKSLAGTASTLEERKTMRPKLQ